MTIFLIGGGTGGPSSPLLAVAEYLQTLGEHKFYFVGTKKGVDQAMLATSSVKVRYLSIPAGKWRRYFAWQNFFDLFKIFFGFLKSLYFLGKFKPDLVFGAGSFVQVPVAWAAYFFRIPIVIHQQDLEPLLSTKLVAPFAKSITVSFSYSGKNIPESLGLFSQTHKSKIQITGNPVRAYLRQGSRKLAKKIFSLTDRQPTILIMGGGTGSEFINKVVIASLPQLLEYVQVIHATGGRWSKQFDHPNYHPYIFLGKELPHAYKVADLVICRGGMSTLSELSVLKKAGIVIPLPDSPQVSNAQLFAYLNSIVMVSESELTPDWLSRVVRKILWDGHIQKTLQQNIARVLPSGATPALAKIILQYEK